MIYQGDCRKIIPTLPVFDCLIADPPDNIGLSYNWYWDKMEPYEYKQFLWDCLNLFVKHANISWISFNSKWIFMVGSLVERLKTRYPDIDARIFCCSFTFGPHRHTDCGYGYRPLLRLKRKTVPLYPDRIRVKSARQKTGDKRADPRGCVPLDHWEFPRVTGNSKQRRSWHPTQLNEGLVERCIKLSTSEDGTVLDVFSGSGTTIRVCNQLNQACTSIEISPFYCKKLAIEHNLTVIK